MGASRTVADEAPSQGNDHPPREQGNCVATFRYEAPPGDDIAITAIDPSQAGDIILADGEVVNARHYLHQVRYLESFQTALYCAAVILFHVALVYCVTVIVWQLFCFHVAFVCPPCCLCLLFSIVPLFVLHVVFVIVFHVAFVYCPPCCLCLLSSMLPWFIILHVVFVYCPSCCLYHCPPCMLPLFIILHVAFVIVCHVAFVYCPPCCLCLLWCCSFPQYHLCLYTTCIRSISHVCVGCGRHKQPI